MGKAKSDRYMHALYKVSRQCIFDKRDWRDLITKQVGRRKERVKAEITVTCLDV